MNDALRYEPLRGVGAQVHGLRGADVGSASVHRSLNEAFERHGLLLARGLDLSVDEQITLGGAFGKVVLRERNAKARDDRRTQHVSNVTDDGVFGTGTLDFHMDQLFWPTPLKALMLFGIEVPERGGDTSFVDTSRAVAGMPPALRERLANLRARHAYTFAGTLARDWHVEDAASQSLEVTHPVLWRDPIDTPGERVGLWLNAMTTVGIEGMDDQAGRSLIAKARGHLYDEALTYTHRWRAGDLLVWDNRWIAHARAPFDEGCRRTLRRTTLL